MCLSFTDDVATRGASDQTREKARDDLVDFSSPDLNRQHVTNSRPSISLVRSNGQNFTSQSVNRGVARGCL